MYKETDIKYKVDGENKDIKKVWYKKDGEWREITDKFVKTEE